MEIRITQNFNIGDIVYITDPEYNTGADKYKIIEVCGAYSDGTSELKPVYFISSVSNVFGITYMEVQERYLTKE